MSARLCTRLSRRYLVCHDKPLSRQLLPLQQISSSFQTAQIDPKYARAQHTQSRTTTKRERQAAYTKAYDEATASIAIDGETHKFPPILLRDLCSCLLCVDQSTRQKLFVTADIPLNIHIAECVPGPEVVTISWSNDAPGYGPEHRSEIPLSTLRNLVSHGKPRANAIVNQDLPKRVHWDAEHYSTKCPDFDYNSYTHDDSVLLAALQQLQTHGLVFVTSVPEDEKSVENLAERIGPLKTTFYGRTWDVRSVPKAKNVAYTSQNLGFHMDLMYLKQPPHLQLLHCIRSSAAGGASLFTDSFKAVQDLHKFNKAHFRALSQIKAAFHYDHPESQYYHQFRSVIEQDPKHINDFKPRWHEDIPATTEQGIRARILFDPMDFVSAVAWSPPFQAPFALDRDIMEGVTGPGSKEHALDTQPWNEALGRDVFRWHAAARTFNQLIHRPENIYERLMKPGECVIFDNRRVLHARKAFEVGDAGMERWLRGCYIDKDPYLSMFRTLTAQKQEFESLMK